VAVVFVALAVVDTMVAGFAVVVWMVVTCKFLVKWW
jgi:hypothetical protein